MFTFLPFVITNTAVTKCIQVFNQLTITNASWYNSVEVILKASERKMRCYSH